MQLCIRCKGRGWCGRPCRILAKIKQFQPKVKLDFSGSSPPEVFVGRYNYPNVFTGVLAPNEYGATEKLSEPEEWYKEHASIEDILGYRAKMIYSRFTTNIKSGDKLRDFMQETAMASKHIDASFKLKSPPQIKMDLNKHIAIIGNPAPLIKAKFDSNPRIEPKVDYLVNDTDAKSVVAIQELYESKIKVSNIIKILSAGLLGKKFNRRMVPTRWAVTATDDTLSKELLKKIRYYSELQEYRVFSGEYIGNNYSIILVPGCWGFEVIEISKKGFWNPEFAVWQDYEDYYGRKKYADSVTGGYYAVRLPVTEYLEGIQKQCSVLVLREVKEEYWAPLGVGILRELVRDILNNKFKRFDSLKEALCSLKFEIPVETFKDRSKLLKERKTQKRLLDFGI
ncbi:MAG: hypothetical protein ABH817_00565 [archaeon]